MPSLLHLTARGLLLLDRIPGSGAAQSQQENGLDYHGEEEDFGRKATDERTPEGLD